MEVPSILYRSVRTECARENHLKGNLWFRSHSYFQVVEGGDKLEGIGSYDIAGQGHYHNISDDYRLQPGYFMSFSEELEAAQKFGDFPLELNDPIRFLEGIKGQLPPIGGFVRVKWIKMGYGKTREIARHLGPSEGWHRQFHQKPEKFAQEREWRLEIRFLQSFRIQNCTLKFRWPRLGYCFAVSTA